MKRVSGQNKAVPVAPTPSLHEASSNIDKCVNDRDAKIGKLEAELAQYKQKLKSTKGAARQQYQRRAMEVLKHKRMLEGQRDSLAGQQFNIESAAFGIETVEGSLNTEGAMKAANVHVEEHEEK